MYNHNNGDKQFGLFSVFILSFLVALFCFFRYFSLSLSLFWVGHKRLCHFNDMQKLAYVTHQRQQPATAPIATTTVFGNPLRDHLTTCQYIKGLDQKQKNKKRDVFSSMDAAKYLSKENSA